MMIGYKFFIRGVSVRDKYSNNTTIALLVGIYTY